MYVGRICRNKQGRLGIVLGHHYDHKRGGVPHKWWGIGIRGGTWRSEEMPQLVAASIEDYARRHKDIQKHHQDMKHGD